MRMPVGCLIFNDLILNKKTALAERFWRLSCEIALAVDVFLQTVGDGIGGCFSPVADTQL